MSGLELKVDGSALVHLAEQLAATPKKIRPAIRMAINDTGDRTRTPMKRALVDQTGLRTKVINAAVATDRATDGNLTYSLRSHGGNVRLKYFTARETQGGVSAAPRNVRQIFASTFMKGGRFPNRVVASRLNGQVFIRTGSRRLPIQVVRSGVFIPIEMVTGASAAAFDTTSTSVLPVRLAHHIGRALGGA